MPSSKLLGSVACLILTIGIAGTAQGQSAASRPNRAQATAAASSIVPSSPCNAVSTPAATELATPAATVTVTPTLAATTAATPDNTLIRLVSFAPTDIHFNPDPVKPVAVIIVFSFIFQSQSAESLHIESPRFQLAIDDVAWGALSSTDFQTGTLPANGEQGIVLQSLTLVKQTTPAQGAILACLRDQQPVTLTLSGTLNAFPGGVKQSIVVNFTTEPIIVRARQAAGQ